MGTEVRTYRNWEDEWATSSGEGPYVDGKREGHWVLHWGGDVLEGSYVDDSEHGHWVVRRADGSCSNVEYSRGDIVSSSDC